MREVEKLRSIGIKLGGVYLDGAAKKRLAADSALAGGVSAGVPAQFTSYVDPDVVRVVTSPCEAENIFDPVRKGEFGTLEARFIMLEDTGKAAIYGDYSTEGIIGGNASFPRREAYYFQSIINYGDMEAAVSGMAAINLVSERQRAAALALSQARNQFWFYGVEGLENYGILNDPRLTAPIAPKAGQAGVKWEEKSATEIFDDIMELMKKLIVQGGGAIRETDPLKLCLSPSSSVNLSKANEHGVTVKKLLNESYPNISVVTASEYNTKAGNLAQLIAAEVSGKNSGELGYTELMYAHNPVQDLSSYRQKISASSYGAVIRYPFAVAQMLGI